jgi:hypothetical protein
MAFHCSWLVPRRFPRLLPSNPFQVTWLHGIESRELVCKFPAFYGNPEVHYRFTVSVCWFLSRRNESSSNPPTLSLLSSILCYSPVHPSSSKWFSSPLFWQIFLMRLSSVLCVLHALSKVYFSCHPIIPDYIIFVVDATSSDGLKSLRQSYVFTKITRKENRMQDLNVAITRSSGKN